MIASERPAWSARYSCSPGSSHRKGRNREGLPAGSCQHCAFPGGTALRFLYRLPRFSEDLDFSRIGAAQPLEVLTKEFDRRIKGVNRALTAEEYTVETRDSCTSSAFRPVGIRTSRSRSVIADVAPFLERHQEIAILTRENGS
ncbi:MAG: hypothetical protein EA427_16045 [Spirochaetaceae bacterium]|nr:MAG: hypothetical protein EA427_16045 [Spirochaetaceae bacterium]